MSSLETRPFFDPCPCIKFNWSLQLLFFRSTLQSTDRIIYFLRPRFDYRPGWLLSIPTYNEIFTEQWFCLLLVRIRCIYIYLVLILGFINPCDYKVFFVLNYQRNICGIFYYLYEKILNSSFEYNIIFIGRKVSCVFYK